MLIQLMLCLYNTLYNTGVIDIAVYESEGDSPTITATSGLAYFNHGYVVNLVFPFSPFHPQDALN